MKIDNTGKALNTNLNKPAPPAATGATDSSTKDSSAASPEHSANVEALQVKWQTLNTSLATQPLIDKAKIAELRQAIADGRLSIRHERIADQLIASVKALLAKQPPES